MDEHQYARQGGAICEQCHQPLMPTDNAVGNNAVGNNGVQPQWGGEQAAGVNAWPSQPPAGRVPSLPPRLPNGGIPARSSVPGLPPVPGNHPLPGLPPVHSNHSMPGLSPMHSNNPMPGIPPIQGSHSLPGNHMMSGLPPMPSNNPLPSNNMDIQWGQQPLNAGQWGEQAQWGAMADQPAETQALLEPVPSPMNSAMNSAMNSPMNSERTMALDLDNDLGGFPSMPQSIAQNMGTGGMAATVNFMSTINLNDGKDEGNNLRQFLSIPNRSQKENAEVSHEENTQEIDISELEKIYDDKVNPFVKFFKSIPLRYLIILGSVLVVSIISFIIAVIVVNKPPEVETEITKHGEIVPVGTEQPKTFADIVEESVALSSSFLPFDGEKVTEGSVVAVAADIGIYYDAKKIADIEDVQSGDVFVEKLFKVASEDVDNIDKPIIFLFDESLPMSTVYRTVYSMAPSARKVLLGATLSNGLTAIEVQPCAWPDYEMFTFGECKSSTIDVQITKRDISMMRTIGEEPLAMDENNEPQLELIDDIIGSSKINLKNIRRGLDKMRLSKDGYVRFVTDNEVSFGVFFRTVIEFYGTSSAPNTQEMYLAPLTL